MAMRPGNTRDPVRVLYKGLLEVTPIVGERYRYHVASSNPKKPPYLCDLEARFPMGRCSCENYECVRWPAFKKSLMADPCKHIHSALIFHALRNILETSRQLKRNEGE